MFFESVGAWPGNPRLPGRSGYFWSALARVTDSALEDMLGAGAICDFLWDDLGQAASDAARLARDHYCNSRDQLLEIASQAANARRLLGISGLAKDVPVLFSARYFSGYRRDGGPGVGFCVSYLNTDQWNRGLHLGMGSCAWPRRISGVVSPACCLT